MIKIIAFYSTTYWTQISATCSSI